VPLSETERQARSKRRLGCGILAVAFVVVVLLILIPMAVVTFRTLPNPPLVHWIPPDADMAAGVRLNLLAPDAAGLLQALSPTADSDVAARRAQDANRAFDILQFFLHSDILATARLDARTLQPQWAVVANMRRADRLMSLVLGRALGDRLRWESESGSGTRGVIRRFRVDPPGWFGALAATQAFLSNDSQWLDSILIRRVGAEEKSPLESALSLPSPVGLAIADPNGRLAEAADKAAGLRSISPQDAALIARARQLLSMLRPPASANVELWLSSGEARAEIRPTGAPAIPRAAMESLGREIAESVKRATGGKATVEASVTVASGDPQLELRIPDFGKLLGQLGRLSIP